MNTKMLLAATLFAGATLGSQSAFALDGDAAAGEKVFNRCKSCHMVGPEAKNKVGPALTGVIGRTAGTYEDYKYGASLVAAGEKGLVWDAEQMTEYLVDPRKYLRAYLDDSKAKSKMAFKLRDEQDRADVIAYLTTFSEGVEEGESAAEEGEEAESTTQTN